MLGLLLVFLTSVTGQVTSCQLAAGSSCDAPAQQAICIEVCNKHHTNNSCSQNPACVWNNNDCTNSNSSSQCYLIQNSGVCATSPGCAWEVSPCKFGGQCGTNNGSLTCGGLTSSSTCAAQGCQWTPECQPSNACGLLDDQASCTSSSGCFWYQVYVNDSLTGYTSSHCSPCFTDPYNNTDNFYATIAAHVGQVCHTYPFDNLYLDATPAAAGCSGGVVYAPGNGLDNCSTPGPTAAPTTPNPSATAEPTAAPTAAPNTPAPTAAPNTPAPTAAPNTAAPTAAPNTVAPTAAPTTEAPSIVNGAEQLFAPVALAFSLLFLF